jgi:CheY-like chemotaxis protein
VAVESRQNPKIVVVDDEAAIVNVVTDVLEDQGNLTISCVQSREAYARIVEEAPQLVILDVVMPGVDGIEIFRQLRGNSATSAIPVIFFTANSEILRRNLPDFEEQGAMLLPKPFRVRKLLDLVRKALGDWE